MGTFLERNTDMPDRKQMQFIQCVLAVPPRPAAIRALLGPRCRTGNDLLTNHGWG